MTTGLTKDKRSSGLSTTLSTELFGASKISSGLFSGSTATTTHSASGFFGTLTKAATAAPSNRLIGSSSALFGYSQPAATTNGLFGVAST